MSLKKSFSKKGQNVIVTAIKTRPSLRLPSKFSTNLSSNTLLQWYSSQANKIASLLDFSSYFSDLWIIAGTSKVCFIENLQKYKVTLLTQGLHFFKQFEISSSLRFYIFWIFEL